MSRWRGWSVPIVVLTAFASAGSPYAPWSAAAAAKAGETVSASGATPVLSLRRLPWWLAQTAAQQRLDAQLSTLAGPSLGSGASAAGCLVVSQGGRELFGDNGHDMFIPASSLKILTATAVLDRLGATAKFVTSVRSAHPADGGVLVGNLYLVGGGDPDLRTSSYGGGTSAPGATFTSLDALALQVREAGISEVTGSVIGDDSRYDSQRIVASWKPVYTSEGDVGPLSALDVNDGFVPASTTTTLPPPPGGTAAPHPTITTVAGSPTSESSNSAQLAYAAAANPSAQAAQIFTTLLRKDGVRVEGAARTGETPASSVPVTSVTSAPLSAEVDQMLNVSDDTAAELFTKELGYQQSHSGTTAAGTAAIRVDLAADGLPVAELVNLDGSGLDRGDRASCELLADALRRAGTTGVLAKGLPVAGKSGTLVYRMTGTPAAGRVIAKTGTLDNVVSLSGFVLPAPGSPETPALGQPLVFALILNGPPDWAATGVADAVAEALARYPVLPPIAELEPAPSKRS
jgi:D-alanyl-D-alanine carboxypeptidase/D-alanyl-D-alanine-endopeptidase (penicillin-binding protein 4)